MHALAIGLILTPILLGRIWVERQHGTGAARKFMVGAWIAWAALVGTILAAAP